MEQLEILLDHSLQHVLGRLLHAVLLDEEHQTLQLTPRRQSDAQIGVLLQSFLETSMRATSTSGTSVKYPASVFTSSFTSSQSLQFYSCRQPLIPTGNTYSTSTFTLGSLTKAS